jgi:hypothetical protein
MKRQNRDQESYTLHESWGEARVCRRHVMEALRALRSGRYEGGDVAV